MPRETDPVTTTERFVRSASSAGESAPGDYLILDLRSGRYYGVGEVGGFIWERLDGERDLAAIARAISARFEVDPERAAEDLIEFVTWLREIGLAVRAEDS
ncbi:MAG: PqqD family protein [bacterium]|nr:PqqD family protein [bacterium]